VTFIVLYFSRNQENNSGAEAANTAAQPERYEREVIKMNENINEKLDQELNEQIIPLTEEELAEVTGGSHSYIEGDNGKYQALSTDSKKSSCAAQGRSFA